MFRPIAIQVSDDRFAQDCYPPLSHYNQFHCVQITCPCRKGHRVGVVRLSRRAHNPETGGSNPPSDTNYELKVKVK
jgi:hypothetical protein